MGLCTDLDHAGVPLGLRAQRQQIPVVSGLFAAQPSDVLHVPDPSGHADHHGVPDARAAAPAAHHGADDIPGQRVRLVRVRVRAVRAVRSAGGANTAAVLQEVVPYCCFVFFI